MEINREEGIELLGGMIVEYLENHYKKPYWFYTSVATRNEGVEIQLQKGMEKHILFKLSFNRDGRTFHMNPQLLHLLPRIERDKKAFISGKNIVDLFSALDFNMRTL